MRIQVQKWGNSLALRIPRSFALESRIEQGSEVELSLAGDRLIITPVRKPSYDLKDLLKNVSPENLHGEIDTGPPVGKEIG